MRKVLATALLTGLLLVSGACASLVRFESVDKTLDKSPQMLTGLLMKPSGGGPFPAVVMLHGADGLQDFYRPWATRLRGWGYVTLQVDSFGPRGLPNAFGRWDPVLPIKRALDAHGAKLYLARLPFVDPKRIAVMGWSHGGSAALHAVHQRRWEEIPRDPFRAGVAFYPGCQLMMGLNAPLLVLIGEKDDWSSASDCRTYIPLINSQHEAILKAYPGAYHSFDHQFPLHLYMGHWVGLNWKAASAAYEEVKKFLAKHLK
jgi:dienelactone hydrolase